MRRKLYPIIALALWLSAGSAAAQGEASLTLTLEQAIRMAQEHSPQAQSARHTYRSAYWNYRYYRANYLPSVTLSSSPTLNRQISKIVQPDGTNKYLEQNQLTADLSLTINQNIALTGGNLFVKSSTQRNEEFENNVISFNTQPVVIGYQQSLFGYNSLKWDRRIEPVRYREACKAYAEALELVASQTSSYFFALATAQTNLDIASSNYASADTLYRYAQGRYNIGTITENEMLQLEINKLSEETNRMNARIEVEDCMQTLRSFLGLKGDEVLRVLPDDSIPHFEVSVQEALRLAFQNSPDPDYYQRAKLESRSNLAYARANAGLKADLYVQFGLTQTGAKFAESYRDPLDQQYASITLSLPILDWGRGKGRIRVARSQVDLVDTQAEQGLKDFELNVIKMVRQFNLQAHRVAVAAKTDRTAERRYEVARRLYLLGKSTILDLNAAISEKDTSRRNYISALQQYWSLYYGIRSMTGYDFERMCPIDEALPEK